MIETPGHTFVLISGSWHGAWCWYKVVPRLEQAGHRVVAVELPGHGVDWAKPGEVTLDSYVKTVLDIVDAERERVVLVGHSRGGIVVSQVAEARPERIHRAIYLCAFVIPNGEPMLATATADAESLIVQNLVVDERAGTHSVRPEAVRDALYNDCSLEDIALATALLTPEPNGPVATPLKLSDTGLGSVRRAYICTQFDRGISPALQSKMIERAEIKELRSIPTGHSPFLSAPDELVACLISLAT